MNYSIKPVVISSVYRLQMNAIFYALILDKNKLSAIHKTHTHTQAQNFLAKCYIYLDYL